MMSDQMAVPGVICTERPIAAMWMSGLTAHATISAIAYQTIYAAYLLPTVTSPLMRSERYAR